MQKKIYSALTYESCGPAHEVLKLTSHQLPEKLADNEVLIKFSAAPIHPSDFGMINGTYGRLRTLPAVAGREGLGEVVEVGSKVQNAKPGDWVRMPEEQGTWREFCVADASSLILMPNDLPRDMAAMAFVNPPTAYLLLSSIVELKPGQWIIQNAASSAVAHCVLQWAKTLGIHTINVVLNKASHEKSLRELGADIVIEETELKEFCKTIKPEQRPVLGFNSVGGESAIGLIRCLKDGGTLVTFGGMVGTPIRFPTRNLIFNDIHLRGFWMDRLWRENPEICKAALKAVCEGIKAGIITVPVEAHYPFSEFVKALEHSNSPNRKGKILFIS